MRERGERRERGWGRTRKFELASTHRSNVCMACSRKVLHDSRDGSETSGSLRVVDSTMTNIKISNEN